MGKQDETAEAPRELSAEEIAAQFATLAVKVVMEENARNAGALSLLGRRKVRRERY